jgi:hypothetical protein
MAAAIGAGMPITEPSNAIVGIGGGDRIAVISLATSSTKAVRVAGNEMDEAIIIHKEDLQPAHRGARPRRSRWKSAPPTRSRTG